MSTPPAVEPLQPPSDGEGDAFRGRRLHFVGIGGSGMSGLARIALDREAIVTGEDASDSELVADLRRAGIPVAIPADAVGDRTGDDATEDRTPEGPHGIPEACDLVIASAAIPPTHPTRIAAADRGVPVASYAEAIGLAMRGRLGVSIAGTHGKSTTTSMLAHGLVRCGLDPSFIAGAHCPQLGGGWRVGGADPGAFIAEACEFNRSFHHHRPRLALVNNVEEDHLDFYGSIDEIVASFRDFARLLPDEADGGSLLIAHDGGHRREITAGLGCRVRTFGFSPAADYQVVFDAAAGRIGLLQEGAWITQWDTRLAGEHNALNASAAMIMGHWLGADWDAMAEALADFEGVDRRMQVLGPVATRDGGTATVIDDYGHHPSECDVTLRAIRTRYRPRRLVCVFQPHQHSRTRFLLEQFATAFGQADLVIVPEIFFVRDSEEERRRISAADLVDRLRERGTTAMHAHPFEAIVEHLEEVLRDDDVVVVMGAGPVWRIGRSLVDRAGDPPQPESTSA